MPQAQCFVVRTEKEENKPVKCSVRAGGRIMKKDTKEQTTLRLPVELKEKLQQEAERRGYTITDLIIFILWEHFQNTVQG